MKNKHILLVSMMFYSFLSALPSQSYYADQQANQAFSAVQREFSRSGYVDYTVLQGAINVAVGQMHNVFAQDSDVCGVCAKNVARVILQNVDVDRMANLWQFINLFTAFNNFNELVIERLLALGRLTETLEFTALVEVEICNMITMRPSRTFGNVMPILQLWYSIDSLRSVMDHVSFASNTYAVDTLRSRIEGMLDVFFAHNISHLSNCLNCVLTNDRHMVLQYIQDEASPNYGIDRELVSVQPLAAQRILEDAFFERIMRMVSRFITKKFEVGLGFDVPLLEKFTGYCTNYGFSEHILTGLLYGQMYREM